MQPPFCWTTFDLAGSLPPNWRQDVGVVAANADFRDFPRTPVLSREVHQAYRGAFHALAQLSSREPVRAARDDRYGIVLNVQRGTDMRFECHVDSNPLTALLFCTDHAAGGELVVAHDASAADVAAVERGCSVIRPHAGHLICFDARQHPHYARPLTAPGDTRIVAVMNFYTESCPESTRPRALNTHLYGDA